VGFDCERDNGWGIIGEVLLERFGVHFGGFSNSRYGESEGRFVEVSLGGSGV